MTRLRAILCAVLLLGTAACSVPGPGGAPDGIHDPFEDQNRRVHAFNKSVDRNIIAPLSGGGGGGSAAPVTTPIKAGLSNVADTVGLPGTVVNQLLQGRVLDAGRNTLRFVTNATFGFGGLVDAASELGMPKDESDFGETLYVWGAPEGAYVELPFLGPSTERDAIGKVVDLVLNPLDYALTRPERRIKTGVRLAGRAVDRARYGDTVDSVLHESADSYAQLRLIYLQNRRFELGDTSNAGADSFIDPDTIDTEGF